MLSEQQENKSSKMDFIIYSHNDNGEFMFASVSNYR